MFTKLKMIHVFAVLFHLRVLGSWKGSVVESNLTTPYVTKKIPFLMSRKFHSDATLFSWRTQKSSQYGRYFL
jgi:hypothetical protein